ncbi:MAG TPA: flagellar type III secretion system pore protein FliP [Candidatus Butyricicoccus avistercoris]|uniref:Flagellar biosynthetic protein FliP n=1 Tax=Candidatus Butyricicoccus avistercoris TaxID=2838518 RepID=A0A9D1TGX8_9FIRM|nr:flagellar type III secretion system pore protein FliP [Candidatus Butyricicoccus avistercoris]
MPEGLINVNGSNVQTLEILFLTTLIALLPSILVMMTSFTRIVISLSFLRTAMGTQQNPPNTVLIGISLFLTLFIMNPVLSDIKQNAYDPYTRQEITQQEAIERAKVPLKDFMLRQTEPSSIKMFCEMAGVDAPETTEEASQLAMRVVIPSYMTSELKRAFEIGFLLYLPFLLIDIVVSSTLMSMGMIMLPPAMISMPFKLLLFITVDGWQLMFSSLVQGFN